MSPPDMPRNILEAEMMGGEGVMRPPGCYTLDCYCDNADGEAATPYAFDEKHRLVDGRGHLYGEFPHQYSAEFGSKCRANARRDGWLLDFTRDRYLCPKCNPRSRRFVALPQQSAA